MIKRRSWITHLAIGNIKRHKKRNIFSILSLVVGLTASFLIVGFSINAENSIKEECYKQIDYGNLIITKENKTSSNNGGLTIVRNTRPTFLELEDIIDTSKYEIDLNLDALISTFPQIKIDDKEIKDISFIPIYSFNDNYIDTSLLIEGRLPTSDLLNRVIINKEAEKILFEHYKESPINKKINIYQESESIYYLEDEDKPYINDYFIFDMTLSITGVVDDLSFLTSPKIYYSYVGLKDYLANIYLNNLSTYFSKEISWLDRVDSSLPSESISSYSYRLFLKDYRDISLIKDDIDLLEKPFVLESSSQTRSDALINLINAASTGMELFLIISLLGTALIMGIVSFSFYSEDKKTIAILQVLGANIDNINEIYFLENMMIGLFAFIISSLLSPLFQLLINFLISKFMGFNNIIKIPFTRFLSIPFFFPIIVFISTLLVCLISTLLPIAFSKKISIKEELKDE